MSTKTPRERFEEKCDHINELYQIGDEGIEKLWSFIETIREEALKEGEEKGRKEMKEDMYDKLSEWHGTGIAMLDDYFKL